MKALILAAGLGTRLRPLTDEMPKPLIPVLGVPNLVRLITHLRQAGITDIFINLHHRPEPIIQLLGDGAGLGVHIEYAKETTLLGTGGGIRNLMGLAGRHRVVVINGDALFLPDIKQIVDQHQRSGALATMVLRPDPQAEQMGAVGVENGVVRRLVNVGDQSIRPLYMFVGMHVIEPGLLTYLPQTGCIVRNTYMPMVKDGENSLGGLITSDYFCDLGTPSRYLQAHRDLLSQNVRMAGIEVPDDGRLIGDGVSIGQGAIVKAGCVIGDHATLAPGVILERVVVMPGAKVLHNASDTIIFGHHQQL